ncbi:MAG: hypothetical protein OXR68_03670 [Alphaproteobacteria bacterium]|nr:hypothetical protein [Alphaproteobacteria bacterium]MDD9919705.1 hypothetical protein [Alphaproteobacteria bacterium]
MSVLKLLQALAKPVEKAEEAHKKAQENLKDLEKLLSDAYIPAAEAKGKVDQTNEALSVLLQRLRLSVGQLKSDLDIFDVEGPIFEREEDVVWFESCLAQLNELKGVEDTYKLLQQRFEPNYAGFRSKLIKVTDLETSVVEAEKEADTAQAAFEEFYQDLKDELELFISTPQRVQCMRGIIKGMRDKGLALESSKKGRQFKLLEIETATALERYVLSWINAKVKRNDQKAMAYFSKDEHLLPELKE